MRLNSIILFFTILLFSCDDSSEYDDVIVCGGAGGTSAAIQSARNGAKTLLIEESDWFGGMLTSAGVSAIDGNYKLPSGFWGEFKDSLVSESGFFTPGDSKKAISLKLGDQDLTIVANNNDRLQIFK